MKFTAAGDAIIQRRIPEDFEGYSELSPFISDADASFFNFETTLNREGECRTSQRNGGTFLRTVPEVALDLRKFGFNLTTFNNNHALDFFYDGLETTFDAIEEAGFVQAGVGRNLAEASAPKYLDTKNGRVALIAVNTSFNIENMAGAQSERSPGRPGINGLRVNKYMKVTESELAFIKELSERTMINAQYDIESREGYHPVRPSDEAALGDMKFILGEKSEYVMEIEKSDIERVKKAIFEAKLQADYIIVSVHSHQIAGDKKENPSKFLVDFAHTCIDEGANAVIGHGPHLLRPIEIYKNSPIFYSLGDFVLELYSVEYAPAEFFARYNMPINSTVHELLKKRSKDFTVGLMTDKRMFMSVIPIWETEGTDITSLKLVPIMLSMNGNRSEEGLPRIASPDEIIGYLAPMCEPYGVTLSLSADGNLIDCKW